MNLLYDIIATINVTALIIEIISIAYLISTKRSYKSAIIITSMFTTFNIILNLVSFFIIKNINYLYLICMHISSSILAWFIILCWIKLLDDIDDEVDEDDTDDEILDEFDD